MPYLAGARQHQNRNQEVSPLRPERNPAFQMWAEHYNVAITPTRAGNLKIRRWWKEVGSFQRKILWPRLKEQLFFSFEDLNQEILLALDAFNRKPYQSRPGSREKIFREVDLFAMRPLLYNRFSRQKFSGSVFPKRITSPLTNTSTALRINYSKRSYLSRPI